MGFTGKEAYSIKKSFNKAFNSMAEQLQRIGMGLWSQRLELEKKDATTFMWASFGSKRMLERKKELPGIREERERLESEMEPSLFHTVGLVQ
jgi:phage regulator Rha-like protein